MFVYGTLMPGHVRWPLVEAYVDRRRRACVPGRLFDTGSGFPAALFGVGHDGAPVHGWVLTLRADEATAAVAVLDEIEGSLYRQVRVTTADGEDAVAYEWVGSVDGLPDLDGRWTGV